MRRIPVHLLRPGMRVARPVHNGSGQVLLNTGVVLTQRFIDRLKLMGVPAVYVGDDLLPDLIIDDVISEETRTRAIAKVKTLMTAHARQQPAMGRALIGARDMFGTVNDIIDELLKNQKLMVNLVDIRLLDEYTFGHSVNVCVLAVLTGISLGYSRTGLFQLGMSALLHDIGKTRIPLHILNKPGPLTAEEFEIIKRHCQYGLDILKGDPDASPLCRIVAMQHHERYNGQGYPRGLKGVEIHQFAAITGLVDMYDALTADRVYRRAYRRAYPPHEAFEMLAGSGNFLFDFEVVQAFLANVAAYPTGSLVRLSSGEIGVVVETVRGYSLYPRVRLLFSAGREPLSEPYEVWLAEHRDLTIIEVIEDYWEFSTEITREAT